MAGKSGEAAADSIDNAERILDAVKYRRAGMTYKEIGKAMGYSAVRAHKVVTRELRKVKEELSEEVEAIKTIEAERLDVLLRVQWANITDETKGGPALDRILRIMDRRAKLLGLDAPQRVEQFERKDPFEDMTDEQLREIANAAPSDNGDEGDSEGS